MLERDEILCVFIKLTRKGKERKKKKKNEVGADRVAREDDDDDVHGRRGVYHAVAAWRKAGRLWEGPLS